MSVTLKKGRSLRGKKLLPLIRRMRDALPVTEYGRLHPAKHIEDLSHDHLRKEFHHLTGEPLDEIIKMAGLEPNVINGRKLLHHAVIYVNEEEHSGQEPQEESPNVSIPDQTPGKSSAEPEESQRKLPIGNNASCTEECGSESHRQKRSRQAVSNTDGLGREELSTKRPKLEYPSCEGLGQLSEGLTVGDQCTNVSGHQWFEKYPQSSEYLIKQNRVILETNGNFSHIRGHIIQADFMSTNEVEEIETDNIRHKQMSRFLDILSRKSEPEIEKCFHAIGEADKTLYEQLIWPKPSPDPNQRNAKDRQITEELNSIQTEIRDWYKSRLSTFQPIPWSPMFEMNFDHVFTNLKVVAGRKESWRIAGQHRPTTDIETLKDLIERMFEGESRTIAFVQGAAGTGKSTLCRKLAYLWATNDHHIYHRHLDLVLLVEALSVVSDDKNPCYSIVRQLFPADFDLSEDDICKTIKKCGEKCLLIIDGVDDLTREGKSTVKELLRGGFLRYTNVVITGRPESVPEFIKDASFHFKITGFTKDNALEYVRKHFSDDERKQRDRVLETLEDVVNFPANPLRVLLLCLLVQENVDTITFNSCEIVEQFVWSLCKGYLGKSDVEKNISETDLFRAACKIAKVGLEKNKLKFEESMIKEVLPGELGEHFLKSGVLTTDFTASRLSTTIFWSFPHKSIQEYLSAVHLATSDEDISHDFTQTVDYFNRLRDAFFTSLDLRQKQGLPIREQLSQALENVCPHYKKLKPGYQKYVGRVTCEKRNSEDGEFQDRVEMFQDILISVCEMDQSVINTCISIIRENDDMLRSFITECRDDMASEFLQKIVPIPLTNDRDFETIVVGRFRLWSFDVTYSVGHIGHREIVWPHFYQTYFDHSHVYTGEVPRHQRGSRLPWIHCNCLTDATFILPYDSPPVAVLSILLLPGMDDFQLAYKFSDYLKAVKKRLTLLLIAPNLQCEDLSRVKLLRLIYKCENPNVKIHFDWRFIPYQYFTEEKDENGHFKMTAEHRITKPVHHMYYDKYCPF